MNQEVVEYLKNNKELYTQETLVQQLKDAGHPQDVIIEAVEYVYGGGATAAQHAGGQHSKGRYWGGFAVGFVGTWILFLLGLILFAILYRVLRKEHYDLARGMLHGMRVSMFLYVGVMALAISFYFFGV